jgi:hypothetical protein
MPDWSKLVHDHLARLDLEVGERSEVVEELAGHLQEIFHDLRRQGLSEEDATRGCLLEVEDWRGLGLRIEAARRKENLMNNRVRQLWLPGLMTFILSMGLLALTQVFGPKPWILSWGHPPVAVVFIPWLLALPLIGAVGAFFSYRADGSRRVIVSSIVFPVVPFLVAILLISPVVLAFDHFIAHNPVPASIPMAALGLVIAPGIALLAGGLPAKLFLSRRPDSRRIASS